MAETSESREVAAVARSAGGGRVWAIAAVFMVLIVVGGVLVHEFGGRLFGSLDRATRIPGEVAGRLADAFRPQVQYKMEINGAIGELRSNPKLVVLTATMDAEVKKSSSTSALWVYWGTTTVDVRAKENRVQFYVPLDDIGTSSFQYDEVHKILTVTTRPPVLDEEFVDVQTDPSKIEEATSNGWAKLDHWSGSPMREDARRELRNAVIQAAKQPAQYELLELKAEKEAREHIKRLLEPMGQALRPEVRVEIEFAR